MSKSLISIILSSAFIAGCAGPRVGIDSTTTSVETHLKLQTPPPVDKVRVVIYRNSGPTRPNHGAIIKVDGEEVVQLVNKKFYSVLLPPGPKEVTVTIGGIGNPACIKTLFIPFNEVTYLKIGERSGYNRALNEWFPIFGNIGELSEENTTRCGGAWEPFLMRESDAIKEINFLR